jgi:hypothetical protein
VRASTRLRWALAVALLAHLGLFAWASVRRPPVAEAPPSETTEATIDVEPAPVEPVAANAETPSVEPSGLARVEPRHPSGVVRQAGGPATDEHPAPATSSGTSAADGSWSFSPTTAPSGSTGPLAGNGLNDAVRAGIALSVAEDTKRDAARKKLLPTFSQHEIQLGLVPGSVLATLARELVRRSRVPTMSHAILQFDTDGAGLVASVQVIDASDAQSEWTEVAGQLAADARSRPLAVPEGARGLSVTIEITSSMKTVNGGDPNAGALTKALGAINDPIGTATAGPPVRIVASHVVDVRAF